MHIEHLCVAIVLVVHSAEVGVGIQHGFLYLKAVILDQLARHANPRAFAKSANLCLGIFRKLMARWLNLACLYVELTLKLVDRTEGTHSGLIALNGCEVVNTCFFQKIIYSFHISSPYQ